MTETTFNLSLPISGMTCGSCVSHLENALIELPGVEDVVVNLATNKASLNYDPQKVKMADMQHAVEDMGYAVPTSELTLDIRGIDMVCQH